MSMKHLILFCGLFITLVLSLFTYQKNINDKKSAMKESIKQLKIQAQLYKEVSIFDNSFGTLQKNIDILKKSIPKLQVQKRDTQVTLEYLSDNTNMIDRIFSTIIRQGHTIKTFSVTQVDSKFRLVIEVQP